MAEKKPRSREKKVEGPAKSVGRTGGALGTGPVGDAQNAQDRKEQGAVQQPKVQYGTGTRSTQSVNVAAQNGFGKRGAGGQSPGTQQAALREEYIARNAEPPKRTRAPRNKSFRLILLLLALMLGGSTGLNALMQMAGGGTPSSGSQSSQPSSVSQPATPSASGAGQAGTLDLSSLLAGLGGGSVSTGWQATPNTGRLDTSVVSGAREKYTKLLGGGRDTATIMIYMCGTDLESRSGMGTSDLQEMLGARFDDTVRVLVYTGGCKAWKNNAVSSSTNQIWQVRGGQLVPLVNDLGSVPMTDPDNLSGFIQWCAKEYPASRYELILWDHGGGSVSGYGYDEKFARAGSMDLAGVDKALKAGGVQFDFIGFDACLMATAETALTLADYADYLIASEETEPGVGWYYTDWLTAFGENTSMPTIELGQRIVDSFVDTCAQKCPGQQTTLSVIDLAEFEATVPAALADFSKDTAGMIRDKQYAAVSKARSGAREFARSSRIDQIDLVHLAQNMGTTEGKALAEALLGAVKYNRTSSNMTNAYGVSIYFPYRQSSSVDKAVTTYQQIGMDADYTRCIRQFASMEVSGQAASGGTQSPLTALTGSGGSDVGAQLLTGLLENFLGGDLSAIAGLDKSNTGFLEDRALSDEEAAAYLTENRFAPENLIWEDGADGIPAMYLSAEQWALVDTLELNVLYDDGEGYIDLGLDNVFEFDSADGLLGRYDNTWLAIEGQPVAYYHTATVDDGETYTITGHVPVLLNGVRAELIVTFDNENPYGYVAGAQAIYTQGETETAAKCDTALAAGDTLQFIADYYSYEGDYLDSYPIGEVLTVPEDGAMNIANVPLTGTCSASFRFTDIYQQTYWTAPLFPERTE